MVRPDRTFRQGVCDAEQTRGCATHDAQGRQRAFAFERQAPRGRAVQIQVLFCGVCHSDIQYRRSGAPRCISAYPSR